MRAGEDVVLIARGAHLEAMSSRGLTVRQGKDEFTVHPGVTNDIAAVGEAELVFVTLKAHSIPSVAPAIGRVLQPGAAVVGAMNGIPWWYFRDRHLDTVDPGGVIARSIPYEQVVGSVVYPAAALTAPGVVEREEGDRITIGEPDGVKSARAETISRTLTAAGFKSPLSTRLRGEIWLKLVGNATLNPISAVTRATMGEMFGSERSRSLIRSLMEEVVRVAAAYDVDVPVSVEKRMQGAAAVAGHKTSMLHDLEAGKPLETDALLGAVVELAGTKGVEVPGLRTLYALTKMAEEVASRLD